MVAHTATLDDLNEDRLIGLINRISPWTQRDARAPHKPLLLLLMLGRLSRGESTVVHFSEIEDLLGNLLAEFGKPKMRATRHNPFWHLKSDGIWIVNGPEMLTQRAMGNTPTLGELKGPEVTAGLSDAVTKLLIARPNLLSQAIELILENHFPQSLQRSIRAACGLPETQFVVTAPVAEGPLHKNRRRDPRFRELVLEAYEYRCCVCGYKLFVGQQSVGVEAAHIKWFQQNGPDVVPNGLALCSLHHTLFDFGAFTIDPKTMRIQFSRLTHGPNEGTRLAHAMHDQPLGEPQSKADMPEPDYLAWHAREVFKGEARSR